MMQYLTRSWVRVLTILLVLVATIVYYLHTPRFTPAYYFSLITAQETVQEGTAITDAEWAQLRTCKSITGPLTHKRTQDCLKEFYERYTEQHGVSRAFSHLALLQRESDTFIEDCHYITHGIGHAQLRAHKGDVGKSFAAMSEEAYFKNLSTCGNGYFHGVVEEYTRDLKTKDALIAALTMVCREKEQKNQIDCFHGMGHAAFIQLEYNTKDALAVCDAVSNDPMMQYSCYMGTFMEMSQDFSAKDLVTVQNGRMSFTTCDAQEPRYRVACYAQHVAFFEDFTNTPEDFAKNITYCKQIENDEYRMACVKFFAGRAIRVMKYDDVPAMCQDGTSSRDERIACTAVFAGRIARSLDSSKSTPLYHQAVTDICRTLSLLDSPACITLVRDSGNKIYFDPQASGAM